MDTLLKIEPQLCDVLINQEKPLPFSLQYLTVAPVEENCPFCGKKLIFAQCCCEKFKQAQNKFLEPYGKHAFIDSQNRDFRKTILINQTNFSVQEEAISDKSLLLFAGGQIFNTQLFWETSLGLYKKENNTLSFYLRPIGGDKIYHCTVIDFAFTTKLPDIMVCKSEEISKTFKTSKKQHLYSRYETLELDAFSYFYFINKIKENS